MLVGPALIEKVIVRNPVQEQIVEFILRYAMEIDLKRKFYSCKGFRHLVRHYRNWRITRKDKKIKLGDNKHLKEEENQDFD